MKSSLNAASETSRMRWLAPGRTALPNCALVLSFWFAWRDILRIHNLKVTIEAIWKYCLRCPLCNALFRRTCRKTSLVFRSRKSWTCYEELVWFYLNWHLTLIYVSCHFFDYCDTQVQICSPLITNMENFMAYIKNIPDSGTKLENIKKVYSKVILLSSCFSQ